MMSFFRKKNTRKVLLFVVLSVLTVGSWWFLNKKNDDSENLNYSVKKVSRGDIMSSFSVDGSVVFDKWELKFLNSGTVRKVNVELGDHVEEGQVLAMLDTGNEDNKVEQSREEWRYSVAEREKLAKNGVDYEIKKKIYKAAKEKLDKEDDLYDEYVDQYGKKSTQALAQKIKVTIAESDVKITKKQLEQVSVDYQNAQYQSGKNEAAYLQALRSYNDYKIISPVGQGVVARIDGGVGSVILNNNSNTNPFIVLVDPDSFWFEAYVEDVEALKITSGMKAMMVLDAYPDEKIEGKVKFISPVAQLDQNDLATYRVVISIDNFDKKLLDGMFGSANLISKEAINVLKVPTKAIILKNGRQYAIIKTRDGFLEKEIKTGFSNGEEVEILSGLNDGEEVVILEK